MLHKNYFKCLTIISFFFTLSTFSKEYQTTHLKSTGGAGVGSVLMDETTFLNPAPISFFEISSIYFQHAKSKSLINSENPGADTTDMTIIASDSKGDLDGSFSYVSRKNDNIESKRFAFAMASLIGKQSSLGVTYIFEKNKHFENFEEKSKSDSNYINIGATHFVSPEMSMGFLLIDPMKKKENYTKALVGAQYVIKDMVSLLLDVGADYNRDLTETKLYKAAVQLRIFKDFFAKFGVFEDSGTSERGNGVGLGWVQPRLVINLSLNNTRSTKLNTKNKESSLSLSYRF